ncbi:DUF443 family protein [Virgibacillus sp. NKC19-3]|uniref:DUF443 family protein n=1 Tax=Virgibacillus saliphilus TaxID=2831674 RepID=UPI001C9AE4D0|nr:DUF443 family protein [Virgibacillus sp. NKC19-3]MBY7142356.1 DUF443 family protein [Virgibacillus sp. NKC19-3]
MPLTHLPDDFKTVQRGGSMKTKIRSLVKNPRYRLLHVGDSHYIIDMGSSFWRIITPFFSWIFSHRIYKVDDEEIVKQLQAPPKEKAGFSANAAYGAIGYLLVPLIGPVLDYLEFSMPLWLSVALLVISLFSVVLLFHSLYQRYEKKLHKIVQLASLPRYKIRLHPKSFGHVVKVFFIYMIMLSFSIFTYIGYISIQNIFLLFGGSLFLFLVFACSLFPVEEEMTTVKFLEKQKND